MQRPSLVKELVSARITLKNIETLTYNFTEMEYDHARALAITLFKIPSTPSKTTRSYTSAKISPEDTIHAEEGTEGQTGIEMLVPPM